MTNKLMWNGFIVFPFSTWFTRHVIILHIRSTKTYIFLTRTSHPSNTFRTPYGVLTVRLGLMRCSSPGYYDTQEYPMNQKMSICRTHCLDFFRRYRALTNDAIGTGNSGRVVSLRPAEPQRHNIQGARSDDDKVPSPQSTRT